MDRSARGARDMIDPYAPGFLADPWPHYEKLHAAETVPYSDAAGGWLISRHAEAGAVLRDECFGVGELSRGVQEIGERSGRDFSHLADALDAVPFLRNAPGHDALRRLFAVVLGGSSLAGFVPAMREIAETLLDRARDTGGFDAVADFADQMPHLVMGRLLGFPQSEVAALREVSEGVLLVLNRRVSIRQYQEMNRKAGEGMALLRELARERRRAPQDDGLSRMVAWRDQGRALTDEEVACHCYALFLLGVETTSTFIGSSIRALVRDPERAEELRDDGSLHRAGVEELLRLESPVQITVRVAMADRTVGDATIQVGERVIVLLGAANRDPRAYPEPARLDFGRPGPPHLAFGEARHRCIGAALARIEGQVALEAFLELPRCRQVSESESWWPYETVRRLHHLPLELV